MCLLFAQLEKLKKLKTCDYMTTVSAVTIWTTIISGNYLEFRIFLSLQILIKMYSLYVLIINVLNFHNFLQILQTFSTLNSLLLVIRSIELQ